MKDNNNESKESLSTYGFKSKGFYVAESIICSVYILSVVFAAIHFNCPKLLWALVGVLFI